MTDEERDRPAASGNAEAVFNDMRQALEGQLGAMEVELRVLRRAVEVALEQRDDQSAAIDYSKDIGRLVDTMGKVDIRLAALEAAPAIRNGPEHYLKVARETGEAKFASGLRELRDEGGAYRNQAKVLATHVAGARKRRWQNGWIVAALAIGIAAGILATLFGPRFLPETVARSVALTTLDADGWNAGAALMKAARPTDWSRVIAANNLVKSNLQDIEVCLDAAPRNPAAQRCPIIVPVGWALP